MLRPWQSACIEKTYARYSSGQRHMFCQATPGAGKTRMSAELAKRLLNEDIIDLVVCFAPSREVVQSFNSTLEVVTGRRFDGKLGSFGTTLTYQAMDFLEDDFWALFHNHRVLAIFDEIHHCSNHKSGESNLWGQLIVQRIQDHAAFTLALSGTPWRSDELGIALARYSTPEGKLACDFRYGLIEAVSDEVCRSPRIVLLDNDSVLLTDNRLASPQERRFSSIAGLLKNSSVRYQDLLNNEQALKQLLKTASRKLDELRTETPDAAGLIVASTIEHAWFIATALENICEPTVIVTSDTPNSRDLIHKFRQSDDRWIIAVGMIAEGTDIPRIQVCCHLSRIRTELYFRQVIGRALRRRGGTDQYAWIYTFAEPELKTFAERIAQDLPDDLGVLSSIKTDTPTSINTDSHDRCSPEDRLTRSLELTPSSEESAPSLLKISIQNKKFLFFSDRYREQLLSML